jgi:hypothetical protein
MWHVGHKGSQKQLDAFFEKQGLFLMTENNKINF